MKGYAFSQKSLERLETVHPDLRILFKAVILGRDCSILCGKRGRAEQDRLYNIGRSKCRWPNSRHNVVMADGKTEDPYGLALAVDVAPYFGGQDPPIVWPALDDDPLGFARQMGLYYQFSGYVKAKADMLGIPVRWGGDWDSDNDFRDQKFDDLVHWELVPSCRKAILY